jgi:hypothetical protein
MLGKFILWLSAIMFVTYGLACLVSPGLPAGYAGLGLVTADALPEVGAMYGGLQTGFGLFCLLGALKSDYYRHALLLLVLCIGGLALGRCFWALTGADPVGGYTYGAAAYEITTTLLAALALRRA